jgi:hypothetical protein
MENLGIFYNHLVYFTAIGNIIWPFGIFYGNLVSFSPFWYFGQRKILQACSKPQRSRRKDSFVALFSEEPEKISPDPSLQLEQVAN